MCNYYKLLKGLFVAFICVIGILFSFPALALTINSETYDYAGNLKINITGSNETFGFPPYSSIFARLSGGGKMQYIYYVLAVDNGDCTVFGGSGIKVNGTCDIFPTSIQINSVSFDNASGIT